MDMKFHIVVKQGLKLIFVRKPIASLKNYKLHYRPPEDRKSWTLCMLPSIEAHFFVIVLCFPLYHCIMLPSAKMSDYYND